MAGPRCWVGESVTRAAWSFRVPVVPFIGVEQAPLHDARSGTAGRSSASRASQGILDLRRLLPRAVADRPGQGVATRGLSALLSPRGRKGYEEETACSRPSLEHRSVGKSTQENIPPTMKKKNRFLVQPSACSRSPVSTAQSSPLIGQGCNDTRRWWKTCRRSRSHKSPLIIASNHHPPIHVRSRFAPPVSAPTPPPRRLSSGSDAGHHAAHNRARLTSKRQRTNSPWPLAGANAR